MTQWSLLEIIYWMQSSFYYSLYKYFLFIFFKTVFYNLLYYYLRIESNIRKVTAQLNKKPKQTVKRHKSVLNDEEVKVLIQEVKKRDFLWKYTSNQSKSEQNVALLWEEVASTKELHGWKKFYFYFFSSQV